MAATDEKTDESLKKDGLNPTIENKTGTPAKRKMKKIWIVIVALVLLIAGGLIFAVPYFKGTDGASGHGESGPESAEAGNSEAKPLEVKTTSALDPFLVNLADNDDDVRVVIVTGAGRAFCAGADLSGGGFGLSGREGDPSSVPRDTAGQATLKIFDMKKPVIAAINGHAVGVGITMTLAMDIRFVAEEATKIDQCCLLTPFFKNRISIFQAGSVLA